ncbi:MAG: response regulator [Gammaproteobacteria bacterium]
MFNKRRLLLVDSSDSARTILYREILKQMPGLDIIACGTAKEARTAVQQFEFEIITTGITLPDMDGYSLIDHIRKSPKNRDTAIFVVSGDPDNRILGDDMDDSRAVTAYFDKAEGHQSLVNFILNFLGKDAEVPIKIVYVDNSATSTAITNAIMDKNNIKFRHFNDAEVALEYLKQDIARNNKCTVDVLISDSMMSSATSGYELIQTVRNELKLDHLALPALLMTIAPADDEKTDFTGIFGAGTNDFITKPVDEADLLQRIETLVNIKRQNEALIP